MEEALWMTGMFVAGAGAGALLSYAHDRNLLDLYGHLVEDLSRMIRHGAPDQPDGPAQAGRISAIPPLREAQRKAAS
jgi:hypothetical protein